MIEKIIIASKNPVKINSTFNGFKKMMPNSDLEIEGISVPSEVKDQPLSNEETLMGALNRVKNAKKQYPDADYWVGIEGGISDINLEMRVFAWIVISSKEKSGNSRTADFILTEKVAILVRQGKELGEADDIIFGKTNSKQANGSVGILTNDVIDRTQLYEPSIILALIPIINKDLY